MARIVLLFCIFAVSTAFSQTISLSGRVSNAKGKAVVGAHVTLARKKITVDTDSTGTFRILSDVSVKGIATQRRVTDNIAIKNNIVCLHLAATSPVRLELFDIQGNLMKRINTKTLQPGDYQFDRFQFRNVSAITALRISTKSTQKTIRWLSLENRILIGNNISIISNGNVKSSNTVAKIDSLKISAEGYISRIIPLLSYLDSSIAVTLDAIIYGNFTIMLVPENLAMGDDAYTTAAGAFYDGPLPPNSIFEKVEESGPCKLYKTIIPFCADDCGINGKCVAEDSCHWYPSIVSAGSITITGFKFKGVKSLLTISPLNQSYNRKKVDQVDFPPFSEGDSIIVSAEGSITTAPFTIKSAGIAPLEIPNEAIVLEDGLPMTLRWKKQEHAGISTMNIRINISYHGGTKGEIIVDCEDNGEVTIPAPMLSWLKSWGIAGYPMVELTRRSIVSSDTTKPSLMIESSLTRLVIIPGLISCDQDEDCPGARCVERRCQ